jgi:hypothetical protein
LFEVTRETSMILNSTKEVEGDYCDVQIIVPMEQRMVVFEFRHSNKKERDELINAAEMDLQQIYKKAITRLKMIELKQSMQLESLVVDSMHHQSFGVVIRG